MLDIQRSLDESWTGRLRRPLAAWRFPLVRVGMEAEKLHADTVTVDRAREARLVVEHLHALGHRRCGYVRTVTSRHAEERFIAFQQESRRLDVWNPSLVLDLCRHSGGREIAALDFDSFREVGEFFGRCGRPVAMFTHNDYVAAALLEWLSARGYSVGDEVAVVGVDNDPLFVLGDVGLTSVAVPHEDLGRYGARLLLARLRGGGSGNCQRIQVPPRLVVRGSTLGPAWKSAWVREILDAMKRDFREPRLARKLADQLGWSESHLSGQFHRVMGCTLLDYRNRLRLAASARVIVQYPHLTVDAVAEQVGFTNRSWFARLFREHFGVPPHAYHDQRPSE